MNLDSQEAESAARDLEHFLSVGRDDFIYFGLCTIGRSTEKEDPNQLTLF